MGEGGGSGDGGGGVLSMASPASPAGEGALVAGLCVSANRIRMEEPLLKANIFHSEVITRKLSFPWAGGTCLIDTPWTAGFVVHPGSLCAFRSSVLRIRQVPPPPWLWPGGP